MATMLKVLPGKPTTLGAPQAQTQPQQPEPAQTPAPGPAQKQPETQTRGPAQETETAVKHIDIYELANTDLSQVSGISISGACDQIELTKQRQLLSAWVRGGGRLLLNGHPRRVYVDELPQIRKLDFHGAADVWLSEVEAHPIWEGVRRQELLYRTGVPGKHSFAELEKIGVAGFYGHAYLGDLPEQAVIITGIGPYRLPVDIAYRLGAGEVVVHAGNDLDSFTEMGPSTYKLRTNIENYLLGRN